MVSTAGGGFLLCSTNFWTSARRGQSLVKWSSSLQAKHGNFTFFFPFLFFPDGVSLGVASSCSPDNSLRCWFQFLRLLDLEVCTIFTSVDGTGSLEVVGGVFAAGLSVKAN